jgi:hypothetical protein
MRHVLAGLACLALLLGVVGTAGARPLNWQGTNIVDIGPFPLLNITGGGVATVNGSTGGIPAHLDALRVSAGRGGVTGTATTLVTDPETAGNSIVRVIVQAQGGTGTIGGISGAVISTAPALTQNQLPVKGLAKICLVSTICTDFVGLAFTEPTSLPPGPPIKGVGVGGLITAGGQGAIRLSIEAAPWTVKTATVTDHADALGGIFRTETAMGFAHGPASATSSTAQPGGVVQLVTPSQIRTNLSLGTNVKIGTMVSLFVRFIPEPGLLLLIGSGVAGLALLGRRRMRK